MMLIRKTWSLARKVVKLCVECDKYTFEIFIYTTIVLESIWSFIPFVPASHFSIETYSGLRQVFSYGGLLLFIGIMGYIGLLKESIVIRKQMLLITGIFHIALMLFIGFYNISSFIVPMSFISAMFCFIAFVDLKGEAKHKRESKQRNQ